MWRRSQSQRRPHLAGCMHASLLHAAAAEASVTSSVCAICPGLTHHACAQQLLQWLDAHGYHSQVPLLQSTPAALAALTKHRHAAHAPVRKRVHDVSPAVAGGLGPALSAGARRILQHAAPAAPAMCALHLFLEASSSAGSTTMSDWYWPLHSAFVPAAVCIDACVECAGGTH